MSDDDGVFRHDSKNIDPRRYRPGFASRGLGPPIPPADDILVGVPIPSDKKEKEYVILPNGILALCGKTEHDIPIELKDQVVKQIYSTDDAFAALLEDGGRVVTWGDADYGGDSSAVQGELKDQVVQQIYSTDSAFAALLGNGRVVTWGDADAGGDSSAVQGELKDQVVQKIYSTDYAFAAVLGNGRVVTWGDARLGRRQQCGPRRAQGPSRASRFTRLMLLLRLC